MLRLLSKPLSQSPPPTSRIGEEILEGISIADKYIPLLWGMMFGLLLIRGLLNPAVVLLLFCLSATLVRWSFWEGSSKQVGLIAALFILGIVGTVRFIADTGQFGYTMLYGPLLMAEAVTLFVDAMREGDINRLLHAIARTRGMLTNNTGEAAHAVAEELGRAQPYASSPFNDEIRQLAIATRRGIPLPTGSMLRFTSDAKAEAANCLFLDNHLRSMAATSFPRFIAPRAYVAALAALLGAGVGLP